MSDLPRALSRAELIDRLRLIRSENVGPITYRQLVGQFGSADRALEALPELARRGGRKRPLRIASKAAAGRELDGLAAVGARLLASDQADYPESLAALDDAPPLLAVRGHPHLLVERRAIAIVGARNASANGRRIAEILARGLGAAGWLVVSGMARGIDSAAHGASLDSGTVAVLAGGVDNVYPPENEDLYAAIADRGVIVSEQPFGTEPQARHFPRRNRLISGLALGLIVVEAAKGSGSLITARFAADQGREVFAVPGSPLDPRCHGSNKLLRDGAVLTESAEDVLVALADMSRRPLAEPGRADRRIRQGDPFVPTGPAPKPYPEPAPKILEIKAESDRDRARSAVLEGLGASPVAVDELIRRCQVPAGIVRTVLLELELAGRLEWQPGNQVSLLYDGTPGGEDPGGP